MASVKKTPDEVQDPIIRFTVPLRQTHFYLMLLLINFLLQPCIAIKGKDRKSNARYAQYPRPPSRGQSRKGRLGL